MQKITPFLWFDGKAEEAGNFYASIFNNSTGPATACSAGRRGQVTSNG
jgi:predicted 3-demethylubiquinone-9 3-methyltransferase (glyoxalase superfamily)